MGTCKIFCAHMIKCLTWMRLWSCWKWCHSTEVIIICIRHDAPAPKPCCLKKHLEIICVHLGLLFFGPPAVAAAFPQPLCCFVITTPLSTMTARPHGVDCSNHPNSQEYQINRSSLPLNGDAVRQRFFRDDMRERRKHSHCTAQCVFKQGWTSLGFSLSLFHPSSYLPETPFPGRWPSQFASSLSKHFTGERLDLHPPIASHHMRTHTHTHIWPCAQLHTQTWPPQVCPYVNNQNQFLPYANGANLLSYLGYTLDCGLVDFLS